MRLDFFRPFFLCPKTHGVLNNAENDWRYPLTRVGCSALPLSLHSPPTVHKLSKRDKEVACYSNNCRENEVLVTTRMSVNASGGAP